MRLNRKVLALGKLTVAAVCVLIPAALLLAFQKFNAGLNEYCNVRVTDDKKEVLYRLGYPPFVLGEPERIAGSDGFWQPVFDTDAGVEPKAAMPAGKRINDFDGWGYHLGPAASINLEFDHRTGKVKSISCTDFGKMPPYACTPLSGIAVGDTEEHVQDKLGKPTRHKLDGVSKTIRYDDLGVEFILAKGKVYMLTILSERAGALAILSRYLRTLLTSRGAFS